MKKKVSGYKTKKGQTVAPYVRNQKVSPPIENCTEQRKGFHKTELENALFSDSIEEMDRYFQKNKKLHKPILALNFGDGKSYKNNYWHTLKVVTQCPESQRVRLAALLHDVGKPATFRFINGKPTFHNHELVSKKIAKKYLNELGYGKKLIDEVATLVYYSGEIKDYNDEKLETQLKIIMPAKAHEVKDFSSDAYVRRLAKKVGDNLLDDFYLLCKADVTSKHEYNHQRVELQVDAFANRVEMIKQSDKHAAFRPALNGHEVQEITGLQPSVELGNIMKALTAWNRENPDISKEEAIDFVKNLL